MATAGNPERWTIKRLLEWTEGYFKSKGLDSPRIDAQILLAHTLHCKRIDLYTRTEEEPSEEARATFKSLIKRRLEGCPVAYLVGSREFYLLSFAVSPAVLIPRPETELLVEESWNLLKSQPNPNILDIGTGSGCIAISIAHQHKTAQITAVDVSDVALTIAKQNAQTHGVADRVSLLQSDLFAAIPSDAHFNLIVSNPPYIAQRELAALPADVRDYEPHLALDGGPDGLAIYRRLLSEAPKYLSQNGHLLVEIGSTQAIPVRQLFETNHFQVVKVFSDGQRHPRAILGKRLP